jgi:hypothetical protein
VVAVTGCNIIIVYSYFCCSCSALFLCLCRGATFCFAKD